MRYLYIVVVIIIVAGGAYFLYSSNNQPPTQAALPTLNDQAQAPATQTPAIQNQVAPQNSNASVGSQTAPVTPQSFTVNGNDETADLKTITVPKGTPVSIIFGADKGTTYHGGLDFRSSVVNTGTITPGSTKTVSFVAKQSFSFTPYWPSTNIAKPYTINIVVQ